MKRLVLFFVSFAPLIALGQGQPAPASPGSAPTTAAPAPSAAPVSPAAATAPATPAPPANPSEAPPAARPMPAVGGSATIIFYRPKRLMDSTFKPSVFVDDKTIGRLGNGENFKVLVPAGPHKIFSNDKSTGTNLTANAGETYYIRIDMKTGLTARGAVTLVAKDEGAFEVTKTKQVLDVDLTHEPGPPPQAPPSQQQPPAEPPLAPPSPPTQR